MSDHLTPPVCLVGAGPMAIEYAKVLKALGVPFEVVGRGEDRVRTFTEKTGIQARSGGLTRHLEKAPCPATAIIAVGVEQLAPTARELIARGTRKLLIEKPAGLRPSEIRELATLAASGPTQAWVAYNRRFYASVQTARKLILEDGGPLSFQFEFTEWPHVIERIPNETVKKTWFLANSTHVVDLAFFLGGEPAELASWASGALSWHPRARFAGAGLTTQGALFSYGANWESPGRWGVEVMSRKRRYILRPLEKLQVQEHGSVAVQEWPIEDRIDKDFKPGLFKQTEAFLSDSGDSGTLLTLRDHVTRLKCYERILDGQAAGAI